MPTTDRVFSENEIVRSDFLHYRTQIFQLQLFGPGIVLLLLTNTPEDPLLKILFPLFAGGLLVLSQFALIKLYRAMTNVVGYLRCVLHSPYETRCKLFRSLMPKRLLGNPRGGRLGLVTFITHTVLIVVCQMLAILPLRPISWRLSTVAFGVQTVFVIALLCTAALQFWHLRRYRNKVDESWTTIAADPLGRSTKPSAHTPSALVAVRCLGTPEASLGTALAALRGGCGRYGIETALLIDELKWAEQGRFWKPTCVDHLLWHEERQLLGRTNRLAIAQAEIRPVRALVIADGDGVFENITQAIANALGALIDYDLVVSNRSILSLPFVEDKTIDRKVFEDFERSLLEAMFKTELPAGIQHGLYAFSRRAIETIHLACDHFASDWEISYRALLSGLSIGATEQGSTAREQRGTSFTMNNQVEKLAEILGLLGMSQFRARRSLEDFITERRGKYHEREIGILRDLASQAINQLPLYSQHGSEEIV